MDKRTYQRMVVEFRQLSNRIDRLDIFTVTDAFENLSLREKLMIKDQLIAMRRYHTMLGDRIEYYEKKVTRNGRPFTEDPAK